MISARVSLWQMLGILSVSCIFRCGFGLDCLGTNKRFAMDSVPVLPVESLGCEDGPRVPVQAIRDDT